MHGDSVFLLRGGFFSMQNAPAENPSERLQRKKRKIG